jgi:hypothetical protein
MTNIKFSKNIGNLSVSFIKPVNTEASQKIEKYFVQSIYNYKVRVFDIEHKISETSSSVSSMSTGEEPKQVEEPIISETFSKRMKMIIELTATGGKVILDVFILLLLLFIGAILLSEFIH